MQVAVGGLDVNLGERPGQQVVELPGPLPLSEIPHVVLSAAGVRDLDAAVRPDLHGARDNFFPGRFGGAGRRGEGEPAERGADCGFADHRLPVI